MSENNYQRIESWMFRSPNEVWALLFSITLLLILAALFSLLNVYVFLAVLVGGLIYIKLQQSQYMGNAVRVHDTQFPEIYEIFKNYRKELGKRKVSLFVKLDPVPNAFTIGISTPSIVLSSALVEQFSEEELKFVIGHELGHVKAGHNIILSFTSPLGTNTLWGSLIFALWQRKAEYTADRCGLLLTKNVDFAITALLKLAVGAQLFKKLDIKGYALQIKSAERTSVGLSELLVDHPLITNRVKGLMGFWKESFKVRINEM